jgi:predicted nuclease of predicted toxin-antitoxin system
MRFLIDAQLPPGLCAWFGERGFKPKVLRTCEMRELE